MAISSVTGTLYKRRRQWNNIIRSRCSEIEQLLHLLRVSLRAELNERTLNSVLVSLNELHIRARQIVSIEDMLDSGMRQILLVQ